ncbi:serine protease Hayan-like [Aricia agestis]|uniref:serine protease Hayan-like n=1 Tax=Aricia agestis TaxID=91739 RepID=UPI001C2026E3|nr:serine protease Hayan-like [Aricia agestis]
MWLILCVICFMSGIQVHIADEEIEKCVPNDDTPEGKCVPILECELALRTIKEKRANPYSRCRFEGFTEIICCPVAENKYGTETTTQRSGKSAGTRVADKECQKIKDSVNVPLSTYIIGGDDTYVGEFPHMVALGYENGDSYTFDCGGSLVSESYVLTAAHCVGNRLDKPPKIARLGTLDVSDDRYNATTDVRVAEIKLHPRRTPATKYHDIALLRLESPVNIREEASPICLFTSEEDPQVPLSLTVTGWGQTTLSTRLRNITLQKASLSFLARDECGESYKIGDKYWLKLPNGIISEQLCAHHPQGRTDTCQGDSGGPLQILSSDNYYRLVGVTSFGIGCGTSKPGVYTKIYPYLDWIEREVWPDAD